MNMERFCNFIGDKIVIRTCGIIIVCLTLAVYLLTLETKLYILQVLFVCFGVTAGWYIAELTKLLYNFYKGN